MDGTENKENANDVKELAVSDKTENNVPVCSTRIVPDLKSKAIKAKYTFKMVYLIVCVVVFLIVALSAFLCIRYYLEKKNFKSFDLEELKKQELIIQSIEFKKFIIYGTEGSGTSLTDELQVYFVSGRADISFTDIDKLKINEEKSDIAAKILRLDYENKSNPFAVNIVINENDIYQVTRFESTPIKVSVGSSSFQKDLIKPDMSQAEIVEKNKKILKSEFERQIIDSTNPKNLAESDLYQTFLARLTEIISSVSDWENVEIQF